MQHYRDLAWAYYHLGRVKEAVDLLYGAIKMNLEASEYYRQGIKAQMLLEMNAMIAMHKDELDTRHIPNQLIQPIATDLRVVLSSNKGNYVQGYITKDGKSSSHSTGYGNGYYYDYPYNEYADTAAKAGKYKISVDHYSYSSSMPEMIRIVSFKNFGRSDQSVEIETVVLNNQYGRIEIGEVEWK